LKRSKLYSGCFEALPSLGLGVAGLLVHFLDNSRHHVRALKQTLYVVPEGNLSPFLIHRRRRTAMHFAQVGSPRAYVSTVLCPS
jgi:hypothetical protein